MTEENWDCNNFIAGSTFFWLMDNGAYMEKSENPHQNKTWDNHSPVREIPLLCSPFVRGKALLIMCTFVGRDCWTCVSCVSLQQRLEKTY